MNHRYLHTVVVLVVTLALVNSPVAAAAVPPAAASAVDAAVEDHGFVPTLTGRFGFDLL